MTDERWKMKEETLSLISTSFYHLSVHLLSVVWRISLSVSIHIFTFSSTTWEWQESILSALSSQCSATHKHLSDVWLAFPTKPIIVYCILWKKFFVQTMWSYLFLSLLHSWPYRFSADMRQVHPFISPMPITLFHV